MKTMRLRNVRARPWLLPIFLALCSVPLGAQPEAIAGGVGEVEVLQDGPGTEIDWEVHFAPRRWRRLPRFVPELAPVAGALATSKGALYVYGGLRFDVPLGYHREKGQDLGGAVQFRSGLELSYRLAGGSRLGVCMYHLSNGGLFRANPGSESLLLTYRAGLGRGPRLRGVRRPG
jgi:hypothetical protein